MSVQIIAHRGWWKTPEEQNTLTAFARAFDAGIGVELDVRDCYGRLVVSHDPPMHNFELDDSPPIDFVEVLELLGDRPNTLAVNVKSCGLAWWFEKLKAPKNWFFFDVAPGDEEPYRKAKLPLYKREEWDQGDPILTISPEIFRLDHTATWVSLAHSLGAIDVLLITDLVPEAMEFFK